MATTAQLLQYCADHGFTKGTATHMFAGTLIGDAIIALGGWIVGHFGIRPVATYVYTKLRGLSVPQTTPVPVQVTPVSASTSVAPAA